MNLNCANVVCFSPTGSTRKVLKAILEGLGIANIRYTDLTDAKVRNSLELIIQEDIALVGVPVYAERIPPFLTECLNKISGNGKPVVLVCVYGNIHAGIALNELAAIFRDCGFVIIAAGLFVGEHTFSCGELPIAKGRPDTNDIAIAHKFGTQIRKKLQNASSIDDVSIRLHRRKLSLPALIVPPRGERLVVKKPDPDQDICLKCGICFNSCPMKAIDAVSYRINASKCIRCLSCVKKCPPGARKINFRLKPILFTFLRTNGTYRKEPELFL